MGLFWRMSRGMYVQEGRFRIEERTLTAFQWLYSPQQHRILSRADLASPSRACSPMPGRWHFRTQTATSSFLPSSFTSTSDRYDYALGRVLELERSRRSFLEQSPGGRDANIPLGSRHSGPPYPNPGAFDGTAPSRSHAAARGDGARDWAGFEGTPRRGGGGSVRMESSGRCAGQCARWECGKVSGSGLACNVIPQPACIWTRVLGVTERGTGVDAVRVDACVGKTRVAPMQYGPVSENEMKLSGLSLHYQKFLFSNNPGDFSGTRGYTAATMIRRKRSVSFGGFGCPNKWVYGTEPPRKPDWWLNLVRIDKTMLAGLKVKQALGLPVVIRKPVSGFRNKIQEGQPHSYAAMTKDVQPTQTQSKCKKMAAAILLSGRAVSEAAGEGRDNLAQEKLEQTEQRHSENEEEIAHRFGEEEGSERNLAVLSGSELELRKPAHQGSVSVTELSKSRWGGAHARRAAKAGARAARSRGGGGDARRARARPGTASGLAMSQPAGRMHCRKAGIRAAVVLIGLLHKSRKQNKEKRPCALAD
ncbi:hypothetical protein ACRRTK_007121 [Alexandromys fortis]